MKHTLMLFVLLVSFIFTVVTVNASEVISMEEATAVLVATVVTVDKETRVVTLVNPEGDHASITAGPEVRNFDQIKRGDKIIASLLQGFTVGIGPKGSNEKERLETLAVARAKKGEKPGVMIADTIVAVGVVKSVDVKKRIIVLEGVENTLTLGVADDVDLTTIKVGGEVEAVYVKAFALNMVPAPEVSATVTIESTSVAIGIGVTWGEGVMTMNDGTVHKFKVDGLSLLDLGVSKIHATGEVYNLVEMSDMDGTFVSGEAGLTLFKGGSAIGMKNGKNVVLQLKSKQKGLKLTVAPGGMNIKMVE